MAATKVRRVSRGVQTTLDNRPRQKYQIRTKPQPFKLKDLSATRLKLSLISRKSSEARCNTALPMTVKHPPIRRQLTTASIEEHYSACRSSCHEISKIEGRAVVSRHGKGQAGRATLAINQAGDRTGWR